MANVGQAFLTLFMVAAATRSKLQALAAVRELASHGDLQHSPDYHKFLQAFFPIFKELLQNTPPSFQRGTDEQQLRHAVLVILCRLPPAEPLKHIAPDLVQLAIEVLQSDNEDNALLCLRCASELFKAFRGSPSLEPYSRQLLDFAKEVRMLPLIPGPTELSGRLWVPPAGEDVRAVNEVERPCIDCGRSSTELPRIERLIVYFPLFEAVGRTFLKLLDESLSFDLVRPNGFSFEGFF